jgi:hypothetical protein
MQTTNVKEEARQLIENLPEGSTWEDLKYLSKIRLYLESAT